jgi:superfamily II DNA helicase RecQ
VSASGETFVLNARQLDDFGISSSRHIPFYMTSATMPPIVLDDIMNNLQIRKDNAYIHERSNDRANVSICVCLMVHPAIQ